MSETPEFGSIVDAAEKAGAAGDYAAAERLLREAVRLQEADLGPFHPDLANTLNNLAIACEMSERPDEAELCYRRAYEIAMRSFEPNHPVVTTSRQNLSDFCAARGKPFEAPPPPLETEPPAKLPIPAPASPDSRSAVEVRPGTPPRSSRPLMIGTMSAFGLLLVVFVARSCFSSSSTRARFPPEAALQSRPETSAPTPGDRDNSVVRSRPAAPASTRTDGAKSVAAGENSAPAAPTARSSADVEVDVCRTLSTNGEWRCDRPSVPVRPGSLFFYTRIKSADDTSVEHRWYRGDTLVFTVDLRVRANPTAGYRTFSRNSVSEGDWRIELRSDDGKLLHEERLTVR